MDNDELIRKIRGRFAVGDVVIGKESANVYGMTREGVELRITNIYPEIKRFDAEILDVSNSDVDLSYVGHHYEHLELTKFTLK